MAERIKYSNKADKMTKASNSTKLEVVVVKAHDGLKVGEVMIKPAQLAMMMIKKGYWKKYIKEEV